MPNIELKNIIVKEKGKFLLNNVSFKVNEGEYIGLLGPSGEGASAVLKLISGLLPASSGKILIDGIDVTDIPPEDRNVGFIFEQFNLFPHLNVLDNLLYGPRMRKEDIQLKTKIAREIISMVRLNGREEALARELSGGMQQRVGIARAVTAGAKILLLDQPYRALDAKIRSEMRFEIREIIKELGLTALHATHEIEEAMITADKIFVFNNGKLEQMDTPKNIFIYPKTEFVANFLSETNTFYVNISSGYANFLGIKLKINSEIRGKARLIIRQHEVRINLDANNSGINVFKGKIIKIRLLGEFIRFVVRINDNLEIISRELLSLKWRNLNNLINKNVFIHIKESSIIIYPE